MTQAAAVDPMKVFAAAARILAEEPMFAVGEADIRGNTYRVFKNAPPSLVGIFLFGTQFADKDFLIYEDERLTFAETWERACRFANALARDFKIGKGDKVAIAMRNFPEWCISYMAIISLGAVVVPLNAWWKNEELHYGLADCGAKLVIVDDKRMERILPCKKDLGLTLILARGGGEGADHHYEELLESCWDASVPSVDIQPEDDFCIVYTSGSTGNSKGVILTHRGVVSTLLSWAFVASALKEARGGESLFGDNPGILLAVPLFHVTGSHSLFLMSMLIGRRVVMMYKWDPKKAVELINHHQLTNFVGVPSQSYELVDAAGDTSMPSLLDIGSGGAKRP
ncbi:MAG TPA: class I adenylate-forming enzyme family protein, partial [Amphiplicatus sp.]|nr:class I adenylate-forming enzyme family protein [Amphiplicatus sp.]